MKKLIVLLFLVGAVALLGATCATEKEDENGNASTNEEVGNGGVGMANPAAVYCTDLGYKLENGNCIFDDGTSCDEWDFVRGECGGAYTYCEQQGGKIENKTEETGGAVSSYGLCVFDDGSVCEELEYFEGNCKSGACREWKEADGGCIK